MSDVVGLTFNDFQENTYIVYDETGECVIFDPGCNSQAEEQALVAKIDELKLKPVRLINTHCHIDHVLGNAFVSRTYHLPLEIHEGELPVLKTVPQVANMYGIPMRDISPDPERYIEEGEVIRFGNTKLKAIFTPGHSPASLSFYCKESKFLIAGDVLFQGSIGRTDLPGGNYDALIGSIVHKLLPLGDDIRVYPGHGPATMMGYERQTNPFLQGGRV